MKKNKEREFIRKSYDLSNTNKLQVNSTIWTKQTNSFGFKSFLDQNSNRLFRKSYHKYLKSPMLVNNFPNLRYEAVFTPESTSYRWIKESNSFQDNPRKSIKTDLFRLIKSNENLNICFY